MSLLRALQVTSIGAVDFTRPLQLGPYSVGEDAAEEARLLLTGATATPEATIISSVCESSYYWRVSHQEHGESEIAGISLSNGYPFPTAVEILLVRALSALSAHDQMRVFSGNVEVAVGPEESWRSFRKLLSSVQEPLVGSSVLFDGARHVIVRVDSDRKLSSTCLSCLTNAFRTSPLKFRFLELYRMIEARFLDDVKDRLFDRFDREPSVAIAEASKTLKSEMNQMLLISVSDQQGFERCLNIIQDLRETNQFAAAIFKRISDKKVQTKGRHELGAALVYQIRCAIVHAGEKDIIFESFVDGDILLQAVVPSLERTSLKLVGIEFPEPSIGP